MSNEISEEMVRERAQAIWQREGCPDDAAERHWAMAEAELQAESAERSATPTAPLNDAGSAKPTKDPGSTPKRKATRTKRQQAGKSTR